MESVSCYFETMSSSPSTNNAVLLKPMDQAEYGGTHYNPSTPEVEAEGA
jgi:hypothetical protein